MNAVKERSTLKYKKVSTEEELATFHRIKKVSWDEKGFEMEYAKNGSDLFLFVSEDGNYGGTFEFTPYGMWTNPFMKNLFKDVVTNDMKVMEVDSFAVLPEYRGMLGRSGISLMIDYAEKNGYTHAIGIADPNVFRSFNDSYHILSVKVKDDVFYKGAYAVPTLFHLKEVYENKHLEKYTWLSTSIEQKEGDLVGEY
ncbi:GNAT family N-acetyltransferase [Peribacillus sp. JNUCC 23]|uniref:GNAT family N-acetyltransferase n=1 Tax=Peribacillus sp. NPDC096379 TaxID=3364393 RepID=UPI00382E9F5D